ncbi:MAG: hypoxanthine-guanine phosphoribosyltransferase [Betaproteobacteria bacterium]|nr:hypoxanthine-guanine phosphoribosyltransferase [Betaproteobacteria bacterium]
MTISADKAWRILESAERVCSAVAVSEAVARIAQEVSAQLKDRMPLVLGVMRGSVVFAGHLLPLLRFPLEFDYLDVTRYGDKTQGGATTWRVSPGTQVRGRVVLVIDDILDEGETLAEIRDKMLAAGVKAFYSAVFADKDIGRVKPISADFVGVRLPRRYVFGFGMDVGGAWRNLPEVYALRDGEE